MKNLKDDERRWIKVETIKAISLSALFLLSFSFVSSLVISPEKFNGYKFLSIDGNETIFFGENGEGVNLTNGNITLTPQIPDGTEFIFENCKKYYSNGTCDKFKNETIKFKYKDKLKVKDDKNNILDYIDLVSNLYQYTLPSYFIPFIHIGEESIILQGDASYSATTNQTRQENGFAHLEIDDGNIVAYLPFDVNTTSTTYDYSNNDNDGTLVGGISFDSSGYIGGGYTFDGTNDYINLGQQSSLNDIFNTDGNFTIGFWVYPIEDPSAWQWLVCKSYTSHTPPYYQFDVILLPNGYIRATIWRNDTTGGYLLAQYSTSILNTWSHIVITGDIDAPELKLYVNGDLKASDTTAPLGTYGNHNSDFTIGMNKNLASSGYHFNGTMDEIFISNKVFNLAEVTSLYNNQSNKFYTGGTLLFENLNFGTNNTLNISIANCGTLLNSNLRAKINDGNWSNFSSCNINGYSMNGTLTDANLTIEFQAGTNDFYTPFIAGNITLDSYYIISFAPSPFSGEKNCFAYNGDKRNQFAYNYLSNKGICSK